MQNVAPARTYAEEIKNKPNYMRIICTTSELLELIRKDFCVETAEQSVLSGISCQSRNSDSFHETAYYCQQYK